MATCHLLGAFRERASGLVLGELRREQGPLRLLSQLLGLSALSLGLRCPHQDLCRTPLLQSHAVTLACQDTGALVDWDHGNPLILPLSRVVWTLAGGLLRLPREGKGRLQSQVD